MRDVYFVTKDFIDGLLLKDANIKAIKCINFIIVSNLKKMFFS